MSHPKWTALQCSIVPIALSVALGGRQNRTVTRATNDFLLQNWNIYRTYRCICWCQCFFFMYLLQPSPDCLLPQVQLQSAPRGRCCADLANTCAWVFLKKNSFVSTIVAAAPLDVFEKSRQKHFCVVPAVFTFLPACLFAPSYQASELASIAPRLCLV